MTTGKTILRSRNGWSRALVAATFAWAVSAPAGATVVTDAANDFIPTFLGNKAPELDVLSVFGTFDGAYFHIGATLAGPVGVLPSSLYVFGFNRGKATNNFAAIGLPNVLFDAVITLTGAGVTGGRDFVTGTSIALPSSAAHISGASITIDIPLALLPTEGFAPELYQVNLWPRDPGAPAGNSQIADFAPNATDFVISKVPEPASVVLLSTGLVGMLALRRRTTHGGRPASQR